MMANAQSRRADLIEHARRITGIKGEAAILDAALKTLIAQHASDRLAEMGGIDPTFVAPPRRRFRATKGRTQPRKGRR